MKIKLLVKFSLTSRIIKIKKDHFMTQHARSKDSFWHRTLKSLGLDRKDLRAWAYYDIANSSFAAVIMVAVLPIYFADVVASDLAAHERSSLWANISAFSLAITALTSPFLGNICDMIGGKKKFLFVFTIMGAASSAGLAYSGQGLIALTAGLYILAHTAFALGNVFYESLLVDICAEDNIHTTSTSAYALGYLASGILLVISFAWIAQDQFFGFANKEQAIHASFIAVGIWWLVFSIPLFMKVKEAKPSTSHENVSMPGMVTYSFKKLIQTFKEIKSFPNLFIFLVAFWFYSDGIGTIIKLSSIYGKEMGIGNEDLMAALVMVQFVGVPASFLFGPLAMKIGPKKGLYVTLFIYLSITIFAYFISTALHFWILALGISLVQGASQALSRSIYALMVPKHRAGEFFGFYSISSKFAGIFGPLIFAFITSYAGSSQGSIIFISILFIIGIALLWFVDLEQGRKEALQAQSL